MKLNRKGFTLIELLVTIVIVGLVIGLSTFGIINVINNSKENTIVLSENNLKEAARTYSVEMGSDSWKKTNDYDAFCVTIGELMNKGLLDKNGTTPNEISRSTYIMVKRNKITLAIEGEEILSSSLEENNICTNEVTVPNEEYVNPKITGANSYTDKLEVSYEPGSATYDGNTSITTYTCLYGTSSSNISKEGRIEGNKCILDNLKKNQDYYVLIFMNTNHGSSITATGENNYKTTDFNNPEINQNKNIITITYNDKDTSNNTINPVYHYFKSTIAGISNINAQECQIQNNILSCSGTTTTIKKDTWYKVPNTEVKITYPETDNNIEVSARIYDGSNNYSESTKNVIINKYIIKFYKNNAKSIDGSTNEYIEKYCIGENNGSCTITSPSIEAPDGYTSLGWNTNSSATSSSWNAKENKSINANANYYAILAINKYYFDVNIDSNIKSFTISGGVASNSNLTDYYKENNYGTVFTISNILAKDGYHYVSNTLSGTSTYESGYDNASSTIKVKLGIGKGNILLNSAPNTYTVVYNANGGTGTMTNSTHTYDASKALTANAFTREGYTFAGWSTSSTGTVIYSDKQSVINLTSTNGEKINLYAIWTVSATPINTNRYTCELINSIYRITVYYVTICQNGTCNYKLINGLDSSYKYITTFSSNKTGEAVFVDNRIPTWNIEEKEISNEIPETCSGVRRYINVSGVKCRKSATEDSEVIETFNRCQSIQVNRTTSRYDNNLNNWWYDINNGCYLDAFDLIRYNPCETKCPPGYTYGDADQDSSVAFMGIKGEACYRSEEETVGCKDDEVTTGHLTTSENEVYCALKGYFSYK